jgi:hypothetical protein
VIAFPSMLLSPAEEAGMKVPPADFDEKNLDTLKETYPHFFVFCVMQLGRRMPSSTSHWENAKIIAAIPDDKIMQVTAADLDDLGFA